MIWNDYFTTFFFIKKKFCTRYDNFLPSFGQNFGEKWNDIDWYGLGFWFSRWQYHHYTLRSLLSNQNTRSLLLRIRGNLRFRYTTLPFVFHQPRCSSVGISVGSVADLASLPNMTWKKWWRARETEKAAHLNHFAFSHEIHFHSSLTRYKPPFLVFFFFP